MQLDFRGATINFDDIFPYDLTDNKLPLVLMHGWGGSGKTVKCIADSFSASRRVITFDFPPFGGSSLPPDSWALGDYTDGIIYCLKEIGIDKADFVGHSFGGRVGIDIASRTDTVNKLTLVDAAGIRPKKTIKKFINGVRFRRDKKRGRDVTKYYSRDYLALPESIRPVFSRIVADDLTGRLREIKCKTLIVWGEDDTETPPYMAKKMHRLIRGSSLVILGGGHFAYLDNFADFIIILKSFIGN